MHKFAFSTTTRSVIYFFCFYLSRSNAANALRRGTTMKFDVRTLILFLTDGPRPGMTKAESNGQLDGAGAESGSF